MLQSLKTWPPMRIHSRDLAVQHDRGDRKMRRSYRDIGYMLVRSLLLRDRIWTWPPC